MQTLNLDDTACDKIHFLTDAIYRNLLENFTPGIRQLITSGRTYQKAMLNMTSAAKSYIDCMYGIAQSGLVCKGGTSELGNALLQLAEIYHQINSQVVDNIKQFHTELLIPLEARQESEHKHIQMVHKKYIAGHKFNLSPYEKARSALRKQRKKAKNKFGFDQKEMQFTRQVRETMGSLNEYHLTGLRQALMEERKCYCFLLDRLCFVVNNYTSHHSKSQQLFSLKYPDWSTLTRYPHILPASSEAVLQAFQLKDEAQRSILERQKSITEQQHRDGAQPQQSANTANTVTSILCHSQSMPAAARAMHPDDTATSPRCHPHPPHSAPPQHPPMCQHPSGHHQQHSRQTSELALLEQQPPPPPQHAHSARQPVNQAGEHQPCGGGSRRPSLQDRQTNSNSTPSDASCRGITASHRLPSARCFQVQALYAYAGNVSVPSTSRGDLATTPNGEGDDGYQLSIAEGDRIDLSGEAKDGWHYGENLRTGKLGWFPLSFTQPVIAVPEDDLKPLGSRIKSLNNLNEPVTPGYIFATEYSTGHLNRLAYATSVVAASSGGANTLMRPYHGPPYDHLGKSPLPSRNSIAVPNETTIVEQKEISPGTASSPIKEASAQHPSFSDIHACIDALPEPPKLQPHIDRLTSLQDYSVPPRQPTTPLHQRTPYNYAPHTYENPYPTATGESTIPRQPHITYYPPQTPGPGGAYNPAHLDAKSSRPMHSPVASSGYSSGISAQLPAPPSNLAPPPPLICTEDDELQSASVLANTNRW